ncbi:hypothetical protein L916_07471 [Phytophthora nicotianae]|uniref:Uncharacterized protein n=2 Tax=Phytophthora nicotianae TaxID=4792 RepID=W2J5B7_PHYNI|nr:hypothetical protein L916_07471 [Phytophthora nicotianae]
MIQEQALDDASSDSLANLFQQVMGKKREYDYDQITQKLTKKAEQRLLKTIDDKASEIAKAFLKRKRDATAPDETSPNLRPKLRIKQEEMERKMSSADLSTDKKEEVKECNTV